MKMYHYSLYALFVSIMLFMIQNVHSQTYGQGNTMDCPGCNLEGKDFSGQDLSNANFMGAILDRANFANAILDGAIFSNASLIEANFDRAICTVSSKGPTVFQDANLSYAKFRAAKLDGAEFEYAILTGSNFSNTDITNSKFGPALNVQIIEKEDRPIFNNVKLSCEFPLSWGLLDLTGTTLPNCSNFTDNRKKTQETLKDGNIRYTIKGRKEFTIESRFLPKYKAIIATDTIYVSTDGTDGTGCGTNTNPCRTISAGVDACGSSASCAVFVDYGEYTPSATINLKEGINLYGGIINKQPSSYQSLVSAPADGAPVFNATGITNETLVSNFILNGSNATTNGKASLVMECKSSTGLKLQYVNVNAGEGGAGAKGSDGTTGTKGNDGGGGTSSGGGAGGASSVNATGGIGAQPQTISQHCRCNPFLCVDCLFDYSWTQYGGNSGSPGSTGVSASGGAGATPVAYGCFESKRPGPAGNGSPGSNATICGTGGVKDGNITGTFSNEVWTGGAGGASTSGNAGGGGGGGGSGGACAYCNCVCSGSGYTGTAGGGGGAGGHGASKATGGQMGGASLGIVLNASILNITNEVTITVSSGGAGGTGGTGMSGGAGGAGGAAKAANDVCNDTGGQGGSGGAGGYGSASGGAAGGNGGPAIGVAFIGTSSVAGTPVYYLGKSGAFGIKGLGGAAATSGLCNGSHGQDGVAGTVVNTLQY